MYAETREIPSSLAIISAPIAGCFHEILHNSKGGNKASYLAASFSLSYLAHQYSSMHKKIFINAWLDLKPYTTENTDDLFYLKLSNQLKKIIVSNPQHQQIIDFFEEDELNQFCCFLAAYVEDLVSETNIWNTFVNAHLQLYGKPLPIFNTDNYVAGEVNEGDVNLLIWYYISCLAEGQLYSPVNIHILQLAQELTPLLDTAWETAPENDRLKSYFTIEEDVTDFYMARKFIDKLLFDSYLFHPDTCYRLLEGELEVLNMVKGDRNFMSYLNEMRDQLVHRAATKLLAMRGRDLAAAILPDHHPLKQSFREMSDKVTGMFLYKGQDEKYVLLEHIATSRPFKLLKSSFELSHELEELNTIVFIGLVRWQGEWWFSGNYIQKEYNLKTVSDQKSSPDAHAETAFLDHEEHPEKLTELMKLQEKMFLDYNGSSIAFLAANDIQDFCNNFISFYNNNVFTSPKEYQEALKKVAKNGIPKGEKPFPSDIKSDSGLVFMNPKRGLEIIVDCNAAFPMAENPYFDIDKSREDLMHLILDKDTSPELLHLLVKECVDKLPFFETGLGAVMLLNFDFFLRFTKTENYHSKPRMSMAGGQAEQTDSN